MVLQCGRELPGRPTMGPLRKARAHEGQRCRIQQNLIGDEKMATQLVDQDPIAALGIKLISSDNHVNEPRDLFTSRFPSHLKDKAPRVVRGADGGDGWSIAGELPKRTYGLEAMAGYDKKDYRASGLRYEDLRPGN